MTEAHQGQCQRSREPTGRVDVPAARPAPTFQDGGSSGPTSRANDMHTDERDSKRVQFAESRGKKRQGEVVEELEANAEEQHLDAALGCVQNIIG